MGGSSHASHVGTRHSHLEKQIAPPPKHHSPSAYFDCDVDGIQLTRRARSQEINTPPAFANASNPGFSIATDKLLFIQSVVVDGKDRVWALDTGRPRINGTMINAVTPGGPKLVGFDLNGTTIATITFPSTVVAADSSLNDVRFDLRGGGFAYITDSSPQRPGIVVVDLASGASWRHLDNHPSVSPESGFIPFHNGGERACGKLSVKRRCSSLEQCRHIFIL